MTLHQFVYDSTNLLNQSGSSTTSRLDVELLVCHVLNVDRAFLYREPDHNLNEVELELLTQWLKRRQNGEPIAYILGHKDFYKERFVVEPGVLVPRPETEHVVEEGLRRLKEESNQAPYWVMDLGCGTGCIGLSLLLEDPMAHLVGIDLSPVAIKVSRENSSRLQLDERSVFIQKSVTDLKKSDLPKAAQEGFRLIVANPPYIDFQDPKVQPEVRRYEPHKALFSPDEGYRDLFEWADKAAQWLLPQGAFVTEVGAGQSEKLIVHLESSNCFKDIYFLKDYAGWDRVVSCRRREEPNG